MGLLTTSYPRFAGDFRGVFIERLVRAVEDVGGGDVEVVVIEPPGYRLLKRGAGLLPNLRTSVLARLAFPVYCAHFLVLALVKGGRCDVLHANWSLSGFFAVIAGKLTRRRVLVTERGQFLIDSDNPWVNRWLGWVLRNASACVAISESARDALVRKFPAIHIDVIPNGVDEEMFSPRRRIRAKEQLGLDDSKVQIVSIGRLTPVKRLDSLVRTLAALVSRGEQRFHAWIVGDGESRGDLEAAIGSESLGEWVELVGQKAPDDAALWMCAADVFVLCSRGEGGGNVVLEAMSAGTAVVSTPVGWARDFIVDGENGILVPVGDAAALESQLAALIESPDRAARLGAAARRTIEERRLNWTGCAERYLDLYRRLGVGR